VKLRLTGIGNSKDQLVTEIDKLIEQLKPYAGEYIYGYGEETLEMVVGRYLRERRLTLSVAESCTGGYLSHMITSVPGSSEYFLGSIVPYSNEIKLQHLGVLPDTLQQHGAVSEPAVLEMAKLVRAKFKTDVGVATSGIAGPGGATPEKPVGTIWIAYSDKHQTIARKLQLSTERAINIKFASLAALNLIRLNLPK
jgi:nicotinamide-nucleotide amidase